MECPTGTRNHLIDVCQTIAGAIDQVYRPAKVGLMIAGLEVPHLHIHRVPIDGVHDLDFANAAASVERGELEDAANSIKYVLRAAGHTQVSD